MENGKVIDDTILLMLRFGFAILGFVVLVFLAVILAEKVVARVARIRDALDPDVPLGRDRATWDDD